MHAVLLSVLQINASDAILIFDEAHNIEDQARCALQTGARQGMCADRHC